MKLLENYNKAVEDLAEYFKCKYFGHYSISDETDSYWSINDDTVGWAEDRKDLEEQDGEYYEEEFEEIFRAKELTAVLIRYNGELYWNIFDNKKEVR